MCGAHGETRSLTTHHRINRGMGGSKRADLNLPANLLTLCGSGTTGCHGWVTANPRQSYEKGWAVKRDRDPAGVALTTWRGDWIYLDNEGGKRVLFEPALT